MAANSQPIFVGVVRNESCKVSVGSVSDTGSGSIELFQADATFGSRIHAIVAVPSSSISTQSVLRLWLESAGAYHLLTEIPVPIYTQVLGVPAPAISILDYTFSEYLDPSDRFLTLDAGDSLYVSVFDTISSDLQVTAFGGDY